MTPEKEAEFRGWYNSNKPLYFGLALEIEKTARALIEDIEVVSVSSRVKDVESAVKKAKSKEYQTPCDDIMDFCGIRIITFIESDAVEICNRLQERSLFQIHKDHTVDKTTELADDRFGYRSIHLVCDIGAKRAEMPELMKYKDLKFEIQVRTILQHAWAEIEHDRGYKFSGALPRPLRRRFSLIAGMLELADREFDALARELEEYRKEVQVQTKAGILNQEINITSLRVFLAEKFSNVENIHELVESDNFLFLIPELSWFGINSIGELDSFISPELSLELPEYFKGALPSAWVRVALSQTDLDKYWENVAMKSGAKFVGMTRSGYDYMCKKLGKQYVDTVVKKYSIDVLEIPGPM